MNPAQEDWATLLALLDTALELEEPAREPWLHALPEPRRSQLRELLASRRAIETQDFLAQPAQLPLASGTAAAGQRVGPWRLLREIGSGGMAWVWLAERADGQGTRRVALKLPRLGWAPGLAERMQRERDILATLEHPNIARLYDAGSDELGRPWLALEFVQGLPIDLYCRERALPTLARVELLLQVCTAVGFAHQRQVIHRDLKPGNILVTPEGQVRLLDFGIAKLMQGDDAASTGLTRAGGRALTPAYASPEQLLGQPLTLASDVYSLAIVAYELLTGSRPGAQQRATEAEVQALPSDIVTPSRAATDAATARQLRGDLDAVLMKGLQRDRAQRYPNAGALADDLRRVLAREPVTARAESAFDRARRWVRRHPVESTVAAAVVVAVPAGAAAQVAVMVALGVGSAATLWQMRRARHAAAQAQHQAERAEQVKQLALSIFRAADSDEGATVDTSAADLLRAAAARVAALEDIAPSVRTELRLALADSLLSLDRAQEALPLAQQALQQVENDPQADRHVLVDALLASAEALTRLERMEESVALLQRAQAIETDAPRWVKVRRRMFEALQASGRLADALGHAREASERALREPEAVGALECMNAHGVLANALKLAHQTGILEASRREVQAAQRLYAHQPQARAWALARAGLGVAMINEGDPLEGLALLRQTLAESEASMGAAHQQFSVQLNWLCTAEIALGDMPAALATHERELALLKARSPLSRDLSTAHQLCASLHLKSQRPDLALVEAASSAAMVRQVAPELPPFAHACILFHAHALSLVGRIDEAEREFDTLPADTPLRSGVAWPVFRACQLGLLGRRDEALGLLDEAMPKALALPPLTAAPYLLSASAVALDLQQPQLARTCAEAAGARLARGQAPGSPLRAELHWLQARVALADGRHDDAWTLGQQALASWRLFDPAHPRVALIASTLSPQQAH
jgi:serine/threonine-protein kinase